MRVWMRRLGWAATGVAVVVLFCGLLYVLLVPFTNLVGGTDTRSLQEKQRVDALNDIRQLILVSLGASFAAISAIVAARSYISNRRGQVSDCYSKAIGQLASDKLDERIGGIYSLQHIMRESVNDHEVVVEVLSAFIREHSWENLVQLRESVKLTEYDEYDEPDEVPFRIGADIQAALTVLGNRPERRENKTIVISNSALLLADMQGGRFDGVHFVNCNFWHANLKNAKLQGARILECKAEYAQFDHADLTGAVVKNSDFYDCDFNKGSMPNVTLNGVSFFGSTLRSVDMTGSNLQNVSLLRTIGAETANWQSVHIEDGSKMDALLYLNIHDKPHISIRDDVLIFRDGTNEQIANVGDLRRKNRRRLETSAESPPVE